MCFRSGRFVPSTEVGRTSSKSSNKQRGTFPRSLVEHLIQPGKVTTTIYPDCLLQSLESDCMLVNPSDLPQIRNPDFLPQGSYRVTVCTVPCAARGYPYTSIAFWSIESFRRIRILLTLVVNLKLSLAITLILMQLLDFMLRFRIIGARKCSERPV